MFNLKKCLAVLGAATILLSGTVACSGTQNTVHSVPVSNEAQSVAKPVGDEVQSIAEAVSNEVQSTDGLVSSDSSVLADSQASSNISKASVSSSASNTQEASSSKKELSSQTKVSSASKVESIAPVESANSIESPSYLAASSGEMRAVWVPFLSLDMTNMSDRSYTAFKKMYDNILAVAKKSGMNTMIVHVRPFSDSFYPSNYFPWSHLITGTQGLNPGYDPLAYMVSATHKAGLKFHAWVNPLRIKKGNYDPPAIASNNAYNVWKNYSDRADWTFTNGDGIYYNPGYAAVRQYIADGVWEIVKNYNVDGVQFDDYFYPFNVNSTDVMPDKASYQQSGSSLSIGKWRTQNISQLVALVYKQVKMAKPNVVFGIAPQGNIQNCLNAGADVYTWCKTSGYADYICPQMYVHLQNSYMPFEATAAKWRSMVTAPNMKMYIGLALYKSGTKSGGWEKSNSIISQEIQISRKVKSNGFMLYSWAFLDSAQTKTEMANIKKIL